MTYSEKAQALKGKKERWRSLPGRKREKERRIF